MDIMGIAAGSITQNIQAVKSQAGMSMLSKALDQESQAAGSLIQGMEEFDTKAAELSLNPYVGGNFDMTV